MAEKPASKPVKLAKKTGAAPSTGNPVLLTGGNPQIAKAEGDAPVQAYIAAMPGWKSAVAQRLDALIVHAVPGMHKAVKCNTPLYGLEDRGWFLGYNCCTKYVKVTFFRGSALDPVPPVASKMKDVRYFRLYEGEALEEAQFVAWVKQASALPGERM